MLHQGYWWAGLGTIPALSRDETTPLSRNQLQNMQTTSKRADSYHHDPGVLAGVGCTLCWAFLLLPPYAKIL